MTCQTFNVEVTGDPSILLIQLSWLRKSAGAL